MEAYPGKSRAKVPMEKPCYGHTSQAGGAGRWAPAPPLPALTAPPPPFPINSGSIRRLPCPAPDARPQSSHRKAQLGFPHQRA